jgi:transcriptional regulator with XRE-family HTH domain
MGKLNSFGHFFKEKRIKAGLTLREFCLRNGFDPGNMSKLERGILPPPSSREKLEHYARCLGLREGDSDWYEFFDLASACAGRIPEDLLEDAELAKKLPLVFRTLRGQKVSKEKLDELVEKIRKA